MTIVEARGKSRNNTQPAMSKRMVPTVIASGLLASRAPKSWHADMLGQLH
jgi:hypothetical protein